MAKLSHMERSEISRKAWRKRKREGGKAKCAFCGKPIFARGVSMNGKPYHKGCAEAKGAGLKPAQVGKNPGKTYHLKKWAESIIKSMAYPFTSSEGIRHIAQAEAHRQSAEASGATEPEFQRMIDKIRAQYRKNPGTNWHVDRASDLKTFRRSFSPSSPLWGEANARMLENEYAAEESRKRGMNPRRKISERKRAPRDAFRYFGAEELNPRRITVSQAKELISKGGTEVALRILTQEGYMRWVSRKPIRDKDIVARPRLDNPKFKFGPTGFRPPAKWFAKMAQGTSASHFGRKLKELTASQRAKVGQIVGGIWVKYTDATRMQILRKYEPSAVRALTNPSMLGKRIQMLNCPACNGLNPVSRLNVYLRCNTCGAPLRSVRVRHKR